MRRGTSIENRFVRTSTLATFVDVTILPDHVCPRRTTGEENRTAIMRGGASFAATAGDGIGDVAPNAAREATTEARAHAPSAHARSTAQNLRPAIVS